MNDYIDPEIYIIIVFFQLSYLENQRERPVILSEVDDVSVRVDQLEIDALQHSLGHVQKIVARVRGVEKHLGVVGLDGDLLDDRVVVEVRNYVRA